MTEKNDGPKMKQSVEQLQAQLAANIAEAERQTEFVGVRFGVLKKLQALDRERERIVRKLEAAERDAEGGA